ncbi:MAG: outer membrane beta-barrel protein [Bacteroidota bacterium]|nr:outer membrane beta-barrel protein [Bacteroidota bacterium]
MFFISHSISFSQIYLGGEFGGNASKIRFDDNIIQEDFKHIQDYQYGYSAGLSGLFYFSKVLNVNTDLLYTKKGFAYTQPFSDGYKTFDYLQLSAAGQLDLNPKDDIVFSPYIGTYGAYWISGERSFFDYKQNTFVTDKIYLNSDTSFAYNRYDLGVTVGIEAKFEQNYYRWLVLGLKYEHGMLSTDIEKVLGWKNRNLSVYLKYFFKTNN